MKINAKILFLVYGCITGLSWAETYWIAPHLEAKTETGSHDAPYASIEKALQKHGGGNIYIFKPGLYTGQITLKSEYKGTPQKPTILKSEQKYKAVLNGSPGRLISINKDSQWIVIDGFDISGAILVGIHCEGDNNAIRNCNIHNNCLGAIGAHGVANVIIENNLIEFNGRHIQFDHGIYASGSNLIIRNNIVRFNARCGIHLYPDVQLSRVENNLVYGNVREGILLYSAGMGSSRISNNTIVQNGEGILIKNGRGEIIANNIIWKNGVGVPIRLEGEDTAKDIKIDYNLCDPAYQGVEFHSISGIPSFMEYQRGVFFLNGSSDARGKGSREFAPSRDFFDMQTEPNQPIDLGCFPYKYSEIFAVKQKTFYHLWPFFGRGDTFFEKTPDLWDFGVLLQEKK